MGARHTHVSDCEGVSEGVHSSSVPHQFRLKGVFKCSNLNLFRPGLSVSTSCSLNRDEGDGSTIAVGGRASLKAPETPKITDAARPRDVAGAAEKFKRNQLELHDHQQRRVKRD